MIENFVKWTCRRLEHFISTLSTRVVFWTSWVLSLCYVVYEITTDLEDMSRLRKWTWASKNWPFPQLFRICTLWPIHPTFRQTFQRTEFWFRIPLCHFYTSVSRYWENFQSINVDLWEPILKSNFETFQKNEFSGPAQAQMADDIGMNIFGGFRKLGRRFSIQSWLKG